MVSPGGGLLDVVAWWPLLPLATEFLAADPPNTRAHITEDTAIQAMAIKAQFCFI
jgi:hypothetical protein